MPQLSVSISPQGSPPPHSVRNILVSNVSGWICPDSRRSGLPGHLPEADVRDKFDGWVRYPCETIDEHLLAGVR